MTMTRLTGGWRPENGTQLDITNSVFVISSCVPFSGRSSLSQRIAQASCCFDHGLDEQIRVAGFRCREDGVHACQRPFYFSGSPHLLGTVGGKPRGEVLRTPG